MNSEQGTALVGRGGVFHVMRTSPNVSDALYAVGNSELLASNESRSLVNAFATSCTRTNCMTLSKWLRGIPSSPMAWSC